MGDLHEATAIHWAERAGRTRQPASGPCGCSRRSCWHHAHCRSSGVVRVYREPQPNREFPPSVILCRECAAPTQRTRVA